MRWLVVSAGDFCFLLVKKTFFQLGFEPLELVFFLLKTFERFVDVVVVGVRYIVPV